jgi:predicted RecB family nuclease
MKHDSKVWEREKLKFADRVGEISRLWGCTVRHRHWALRQGFRSWQECTGRMLGFNGKKQRIVDAIIRVNKADEWIHIHDPSVLDPLDNKKLVFVDFEWVDNIYLIGIYDGHEYTALWADSLEKEDVTTIFKRFVSMVEDKTIVYWYAEKTRWQTDVKRFGIEDQIPPLCWIDLCAVFRDGITVKGAFDFKLKHIAEAFYRHNKLPYFIDEFDCQNGADSIVLAKEYYKHKDDAVRHSIEKYNRFDCESMFYMLEQIYFLFNKHVQQRR